MLSSELEESLNKAYSDARNKRHEFMTVEHLLLALLDNDATFNVLIACGANLDELRKDNLLEEVGNSLKVKEEGRMFVRNVCMAFDLRLRENQPKTRIFSTTI